MENKLDPNHLIQQLDRKVQGQSEAKRTLATAVYRHYAMKSFDEASGVPQGRNHVLLYGPTGCGKTFLVRTLAEILDVPFAYASATSMSEEGYVGESPESVVKTLLLAARGDVERAQKGIIFIDEIDKIAASTGSSRDIGGQGVQQSLLTLLDGRESRGIGQDRHPAVDTAQILFICAGAFVGLDPTHSENVSPALPIGFGAKNEPSEPREIGVKDFIRFGMIPEFMGRFRSVAPIHALNADDLFHLLKNREFSVLKEAEAFAGLHKVKLCFADDALQALAEKSVALGTGARGLAREINQLLEPLILRYPAMGQKDGGEHVVAIQKECITHGSEPEIEFVSVVEPMPGRQHVPPQERVPVDITQQQKDTQTVEKPDPLGIAVASAIASAWWTDIKARFRHKPSVIRLLEEELAMRDASIQELYEAVQSSGTDNIQANLLYLDFKRVK